MNQAYSREETRRLLNIPERRLKSGETQKLIPATPSYGFRELIALRSLLKLREAQVPPVQIRRAVAAIGKKLRHVDDPLVQLRLYSDHGKIHVEVNGNAMVAESGKLLLNFDQVELKKLLEFRAKDNGNAE